MKNEIKQAILVLLKENRDFSFSELVSELDKKGLPATGERILYLKKNLILWENTSSDFNNAIVELIQTNNIEVIPLGRNEALGIYAYGGTLLDLPFAESNKNYTTPHWVPTIIKNKI